jgi:hypothetical protein
VWRIDLRRVRLTLRAGIMKSEQRFEPSRIPEMEEKIWPREQAASPPN